MSISQAIWTGIAHEFSDLTDLQTATVVGLRLLVASVLGAAIGYERERRGKDAGLRTHILVSLGAAIFVLVAATSNMETADVSRVMQGVVAGIGFLGAGAILKQEDDQHVKGLTTAASIWVAAAVGMAAGYGREATAVASTLIALFVLAIVARFEK